MDGMDEFRDIFFTEGAELLVDMEERLLKLDEGSADADQLNAIFRCAHSIKGGSGAFGMNAVMQFTHILEALLDGMRSGTVPVSREAINILLKSADIVTRMLAFEQARQPIPEGFGGEVVTVLQHLAQSAGTAISVIAVAAPAIKSAAHSYHIAFAPHASLFATGNEPLLILRELRSLGDAEITADLSQVPALAELADPTQCFMRWNIALRTAAGEPAIHEVFEFVEHVSDITITCSDAAPEVIESPAATITAAVAASTPAADQSPKAAQAATIRVDLEKVDKLVNMVGELVITEAMLRAQVRHLAADQYPGLLRGIDELSHHTRELQEAVMAVRMQPVKSVFSRMPRIVRDTAAQLGKDIQIVLVGENTEVDKTVIEQLSDPLTHMIRNSVDHGIETPDQRVWNDKPAQGTIKLSAYHRSGRIIIEISDDGAGINRERVLAKAREKGLVAPDAQPTDEEIDHLIFHAGFSTAETVTAVSGRGVGMDVVRRNIESLGGTVRINNRPGKGSTFTVSLPLTLAILDGMIVRVGAENYIVPITSIIETMRPRGEDVRRVEGRSDVINVRGEFVPVVYLHRLFGIPNATDDIGKALIVLVESGTQKLGLVVDELIGQQQVVIKSLEANADPVKGISGATILGDGKVSLILEIDEIRQLCQSAVLPFTPSKAA
jgi:two-component system chemotaxis sensor kinase CheA